MAINKKKSDKWLDAPTPSDGLKGASKNACFFSTTPIKKGGFFKENDIVTGEPGGTFTWYCGGPTGAMVSTVLQRVSNSGGHFHPSSNDNPLSVGYIFPNDFILTGSYPQNIQVIQTLPLASGSIKLFTRIGSATMPESMVNVLITGLVPIVPSNNLRLKPPTLDHPSPYWGTQQFVLKLNQLAAEYNNQRNKYLTITDATLEWGGRFDLNKDWSPPHSEHRNGNQADIRSNDMSAKDKQAFLLIAQQFSLSVLVESDHWHVRG